ncbi:panthothenate synthetase [Pseudomonas zhanjiangensis]|uniref:Panthothenate synthetase n=1 Tax=Pseudomonas zhanjiangensis TaxID=3239015 RepID=A0ABV3YPT4_9PSED
MKMLLTVEFPLEPFNTFVRDGTIGPKIEQVLEAIKPEQAYFTEQDGARGAILLVEVGQASAVPKLAEPFFLVFQATCRFRIAMSAQDLQAANLEALGKQWGQIV